MAIDPNDKPRGLRVLLAGCPTCGTTAPAAAEMHSSGWLIEADEIGITLVACPEHRAQFERQAPSASTWQSAALPVGEESLAQPTEELVPPAPTEPPDYSKYDPPEVSARDEAAAAAGDPEPFESPWLGAARGGAAQGGHGRPRLIRRPDRVSGTPFQGGGAG